MSDLSLIPRDTTVSAATPFVPLSLAYSGLSPAQLFSVGWAYRRTSAVIMLAVLAAAAAAVLAWPKTYIASSTLMVNYEVNDPSNGKELPVGQVGNYIATQIELMQTPEVLREVVDRLQLTLNEDYTRGYRERSGTLREWVAARVGKSLAVYQAQPGSQLIHVVVSAVQPALAASVANAVADIYKEQDALRSNSQPGERARRFTAQLDELKSKVDSAQRNVSAYRQSHALIDDGNKNNVDVMLLATLESRWQEAQAARRAAESLATADPSTSDQVLESSQAQALKAQIDTQELRLAQLGRAYTANHPEVIEAALQLKVMQRSMAATVKSYAANAASTLNVAQRAEQALQRAVTEQRAKVLARGQLQDEATRLGLELDTAQGLYKRSVEGFDQVLFASGGRGSNVSLISRATPPVRASNSKLLVGIVLGGLLALALGLGIPQVWERFHRRVRCRDDLERHQGIPVLAEFNRLVGRVAA